MSRGRTTIHHLPEELLSNIFKCVEKRDLLNCQRICRAWYKLSHLTLLNYISLNHLVQAKHFIKAIDSNPDPAYLNAVKKIKIAELFDKRFSPESQAFPYKLETMLCKLLFRFSNLTHVEIHKDNNLLEIFTDELCQTMLQCCPKLEAFELKQYVIYNHVPTIPNIRPLLTKVHVQSISSLPQFAILHFATDYIKSLPRMRQLICKRITSKDLLTVLERSPNLTELDVPTTALPKSVGEFLQDHLSTRTKPQQDLLLKRLSEITSLESNGSCFASDFVLKYLTGLKTLRLFSRDWLFLDRIDCIEYWRKIVDLRNAIDEVYISFSNASKEFISYFCSMENSLTRNPTTCDGQVIRRLEITVDTALGPHDCIKAVVSFRRKSSERSIKLNFSSQESFRNFFEKRDSELPIDELALSFYLATYQMFKLSKPMEPYDELLKDMPSLKRLILDTSFSFTHNAEIYSDLVHPTVEDLTLQWDSDCYGGPLICRLHQKLPNLKHLQFISYCGWRVSNRFYHLDLSSFSLESLSIDLAPIRSPMQQPSSSDFIMVYLTKSKSGKQYAYEISTSLSYYNRVSTHEAINGKHFIFISIPIANLKQLQFFIWHGKGSGCRSLGEGQKYCSFDLLKKAKMRSCLTIHCSDD